MEIRPASLAQLSRARNGQLIEIADDVQNVANALSEIDPRLRLRYSEAGGYFVVYFLPTDWEEGSGYVIFTAQDLDQRIVKKMQEVYARSLDPNYSFAEELEKTEAAAKAQADHEWDEELGEINERLAHALRDVANHNQQRIFVPEGVS